MIRFTIKRHRKYELEGFYHVKEILQNEIGNVSNGKCRVNRT